MDVTFLEAAEPLCKRFTPKGSSAYPRVKSFTSHQYSIPCNADGLRQKYELIKTHAAKGHALYKGNFSEPLNNESRKGKTLTQEHTESLILDIDGLPFRGTLANPMNNRELVALTEQLISALPSAFHRVSYITQASASMGMKGAKLNLHIEFFLGRPCSPRALKTLLTELNFLCDMAFQNISLAASGTSLCFPIDVCLADNSRIIYIAPPTFEDVTDPFNKPEDRIEVVEKENATLDITNLVNDFDLEKTKAKCQKHVKNLRKLNGLPSKNAKTQKIKSHGATLTVISNPDHIDLELVADEGQWLRFNRVGGDSNAYYVDKSCPAVLHNFKGEEPVYLPEASQDTYEWITTEYPIEDEHGSRPFCFRDLKSDTIFTSFFDPRTMALTREMTRTALSNVGDFFADFGAAAPEIMPQLEYVYDPTSRPGVDFGARRVNSFVLSDFMREASATLDDLPKKLDLEFGTAYSDLDKLCPTITTVIRHVTGDDAEAFERFINWLAYIIQTRGKAKTAWVLHGTQGTGKGVLMEKIVQPIIGESNFSAKLTKDIDDDKNDWVHKKMIIMLDEFAYKDSRNWSKLNDFLKKHITDSNVTVRKMFTDQFDAKNYLNFIICSNQIDPIKIEQDDRRFNVAPRQATKLHVAYPDIKQRIEEDLPQELTNFTRYLLATAVNVSTATTAWENMAKAQMRETSLNSAELLCRAVKEGDLEFFLPALDQEPVTNTEFEYKRLVKQILRQWIEDAGTGVINVSVQELQHIFNFQNKMTLSTHKAKQMLAHNGIHSKRLRSKATRTPSVCVQVAWKLETIQKEDLLNIYFSEMATDNPVAFTQATKSGT